MASFGFWAEKKETIQEVNINTQVHFNLWTEYDGDNKNSFLDIGIKISNLSKLKNINFYVPFSIKKEEIEDLGNIISEHKDVINAVFNENYITQNDLPQKQVKVQDENKQTKFIIYSLDVSSNITLKDDYQGTVIKINTLGMDIDSDEEYYYFRFRIRSNNLSYIIKKRQPRNSLLQGAISSNYYIDFRFNDKRSLNRSLLEYLDTNEKQGIKITTEKVHFLLLTRDDVELVTNTHLTERQLEPHIWTKYLGYEPKNNIIANHWKAEHSNFVVYIKFKVSKCNLRTISIYLILLFTLTLIFNIISSIVFEWVKIWFPILVPKIVSAL